MSKNRIKIRQPTKKGYIWLNIGGVMDIAYPSSTTRRGRCEMGGAYVQR